MYSFTASFIESATFYQEFSATLMALIEQVQEADSATIFIWLQTGYVIFTTVYFGIFPLASLLLAAITLSVLPILCRGRGRDRMRALLGLGDVQVSRDSKLLEPFLETVRNGLPRSLVVLLVMGLVPFLGVVGGVIYYRLSPVAALAKRIEPGDLGPVRLILPLTALTLVAMQPLPVVGPLSLPLFYAIFHGVYDTVLRRRLDPRDALPAMA